MQNDGWRPIAIGHPSDSGDLKINFLDKLLPVPGYQYLSCGRISFHIYMYLAKNFAAEAVPIFCIHGALV